MNDLPKSLRLKNALVISALFAKSDSYSSFPLKILWRISDSVVGLRCGFSVPKKSFKRAVHRNLLKRRMRESFRQHRHLLENFLKTKDTGVEAVFLYVGKKQAEYQVIDDSLCQLLQLVLNKMQKKHNESIEQIMESYKHSGSLDTDDSNKNL
ncbi:MAG: hypothetical protein RIS47_1035 [Bacteroidota bacterium]|jgi:ribonuclease P protein component